MTKELEGKILKHYIRLCNLLNRHDISIQEYERFHNNLEEIATEWGYVEVDEQWVRKELVDNAEENELDPMDDPEFLRIVAMLERDLEEAEATNGETHETVLQDFKVIHDAHTPDDEVQWERFLQFASVEEADAQTPEAYKEHLAAKWEEWRTHSIDEAIDLEGLNTSDASRSGEGS